MVHQRRQLFCYATAFAQTAQDLPVIRVGTRLMEVAVVAREGRGPAAGLTKEDFTLFDNGVPQKIAFFSVNSVRPPFHPPLPRGPNVFTNRAEQRADAPGRVTVIVLDGLNTEFTAQAFARAQCLKVVREIQTRDRVAIYTLGARLRVLQDFTNDPKLLTGALEKYSGNIALAPQWSAPAYTPDKGDTPAEQGFAAMQETTSAANRLTAKYGAWLTSDEMTALARELARIPGRKNLVWLSSAFPIGLYGQASAEFLPQHDRTSGVAWALAMANVAAYPVPLRRGGGGNGQRRASGRTGRTHRRARVQQRQRPGGCDSRGSAGFGDHLYAGLLSCKYRRQISFPGRGGRAERRGSTLPQGILCRRSAAASGWRRPGRCGNRKRDLESPGRHRYRDSGASSK